MPRYRVVFFTDAEDEDPTVAQLFTADAFIIDDETSAVLFLEHTADNTSIVIGAVSPGSWQSVDKVADTRPLLEVKASFHGITERLGPPPMVHIHGDGIPVSQLMPEPDEDEGEQ